MIDLRKKVVSSLGSWVDARNKATHFQPQLLRLASDEDTVTLAGPTTVRVTFRAENLLSSAWEDEDRQSHVLHSYVLNIPAGYSWSYTHHDDPAFSGKFGTNAGYSVLIEPALLEAKAVLQVSGDLPCDFAAAEIKDVAAFFPASCEPCPPVVSIGLPPGGPTLAIPPAPGGCRRPRYFDGMLVTREDMETEQRFFRLKLRSHNRAAGEGVVWGLGLARDGSHVCVLPGYAVDCCGNDLFVTSTYRVPIANLLKDPAAAPILSKPDAKRQPQRMHLLLEYVECAEDPRPVHGDPCSPEASRCEMSRVRETVRLRLVPPRDFQQKPTLTSQIRKEQPNAADPRELICDALLYPGPACQGDPHGVVIGCAMVAGGDIQALSPYDGRRIALRYPQVRFWFEQLGLVPPDVLIQRILALLCGGCGEAEPPSFGVVAPPSGIGFKARDISAVGSGFLRVGNPAAAEAELREGGLRVSHTEDVEPAELVELLLTAAMAPPSRPDVPLAHYRLASFPELSFARPAPAGRAAEPGRVVRLTRALVPGAGAPGSVPPLLRDAAAALAAEILHALPLEAAGTVPSRLRAALAKREVASIGSLLAEDSAALKSRVGADAVRDLGNSLAAGEQMAAHVSAAVSATLVRFARDKKVAAPEDLAPARTAAELAKALAASLTRAKIEVAPKVVEQAVQKSLERSRG